MHPVIYSLAFFVAAGSLFAADPGSPRGDAPVAEDDRLEVFAHPVADPDMHPTFAAVGRQLQSHDVLRSSFEQRKQIKAITRPLVSTGRLIFTREHGLYWHLRAPFSTTFVILPDGLIRSFDGEEAESVRTTDQPVIRKFARIFFDVFSGDPTYLKQHFSLYFTGDVDNWVIGLEPRDRAVRQVISRLLLDGSQTVDRVEMIETNGDTTVITFRNPETVAEPLTAKERQYFE